MENKFKVGQGAGRDVVGGVPTSNSYGLIQEIINEDEVKIMWVNGYSTIVNSFELKLLNKSETEARLNWLKSK